MPVHELAGRARGVEVVLGHVVLTVPTRDGVGRPVYRVVSSVGADLIVVVAARECVSAQVPGDAVVPVTALDRVVARSSPQDIIAGAPVDRVGATPALHH